MPDDTFVAGRAGGSGDGTAVSMRVRLSYDKMLMHPGTVVTIDGTLWNMGRWFEVDETGVLVEMDQPT